MLDDLFGEGKKRGRVSAADRKKIYDAQGGKCARCGKKLKYGEIHWDHKRALALGGSNSLRNLQGLCPNCHHLKTKEDKAKIAKKKKRDHEWPF